MSYYIRSFQEMKKKRKPFFWFYFSFFCIFMKFPNYFSQQFRFFDSKRTKWRTHKSKLQMPNAKDCDRHKKKNTEKSHNFRFHNKHKRKCCVWPTSSHSFLLATFHLVTSQFSFLLTSFSFGILFPKAASSWRM